MDADLAGQTESIIPSEAYSAPDQPYPGLRPFRENEQRLFFGRDRQIKEILQRLEKVLLRSSSADREAASRRS